MGNQDLLTTIRQVRGRWKLALVLRGAVICVAAVLILLALSAIGFAQLGLSPQTVLALRITVGLLTIATIAVAVLRPALRRVSDQRVALYIEENEPALQSMLISAIETPTIATRCPRNSAPIRPARKASPNTTKANSPPSARELASSTDSRGGNPPGLRPTA